MKVVSKHEGVAIGRHERAAIGRQTDLVLDASLPKHKNHMVAVGGHTHLPPTHCLVSQGPIVPMSGCPSVLVSLSPWRDRETHRGGGGGGETYKGGTEKRTFFVTDTHTWTEFHLEVVPT